MRNAMTSTRKMLRSLLHSLPLLLLGVIPVAILSSCAGRNTLQAVDGVLDLRNRDLTDKSEELTGSWQFFPERMIGTNDFSSSDLSSRRFASLPVSWDALGNHPAGHKLGVATFRLVVLLDTSRVKQIAIEVPAEQSSAYVLRVDGNVEIQRGVVGRNPGQEIQETRFGLAYVTVMKPRMEIVLQASNHSLDYSGKIFRFRIGERRMMEQSFSRWLLVYMGCMGVLVILAVQFLGYAIAMRERSFLQFGAFCLLWLIACICETGRFSFMTLLLSHAPLQFTMLATFIAVAMSLLLVGQSCQALFPNPVLKTVSRWHAMLTAVLVTLLVICPFAWAFQVFAIVVGIGFLEVAVLSYSLAKAIRQQVEGAIAFTAGYALFMIATTHDGLIFVGAIDSSYLMILGGVALAAAEAFAISKRFITVHRTNGELLVEVQAKNVELGRMARLKDDFLANTSHELRTPLHSIIGLAQSIPSEIRDHLPFEVRRNLEYIVGSAFRLTRLVNDILDFSKLRHRELALKRCSLDLTILLPSILPQFRPAAESKGLELRCEMEPGLPCVLADEDRLAQILFNLVGNAVKFTDSGQVLISAKVRGGDAVDVFVSDTGIGIAPEKHSEIFAPFEQGDGGYRGGTGLGLSITRKLVELHGGTLTVESTLGKGASFHFRLPISGASVTSVPRTELLKRHFAADPLPVEVPDLDDVSMMVAGSKGVVLAIDDEPLNLVVLRGLLCPLGIAVVSAPDGRNALEMIASHSPAVVLLDVMMPHLNGYEVCAKIRESHSVNDLPVLFLSARNRMEDLVVGFEVGGNDYVLKPFMGQELIARVEAQMRQREAFLALKENQSLKVELAETLFERRQLESSKNRLLGLFHGMEEAILMVDEAGEVRFANRTMSGLLDLEPDDLLTGASEELFVDAQWPPADGQDAGQFRFRAKGGKIVALDLRISHFAAEDERLWVLAGDADNAPVPNRSMSRQVLQKLAQGESRLAQLKGRLDVLEGNVDDAPPLAEIHSTLTQIRNMISDQPDEERKLLLACEVLNDALDLWKAHTGKNKADFAEESGLWTVHVDHNGWRRPATLDKYLDPNRIPRFPKWKTITKSVDFVKESALGNPGVKSLEEKVARLQGSL
jgi:two-component system, sensor histidine kinase ChiS